MQDGSSGIGGGAVSGSGSGGSGGGDHGDRLAQLESVVLEMA